MRAILHKLLYLLIVLISIKVLASLVVPGSFKEDIMESKWEVLEEAGPNLLFLGTSRVFSGIQPIVIDSMMNHEVRSFNFGIPAMGIPYSTSLILEKLREREHDIKLVVIELSGPYLESHEPLEGLNFMLGDKDIPQPLMADLMVDDLASKWQDFIGLRPQFLALAKRLTFASGTGFVNIPDFGRDGYSPDQQYAPWREDRARELTRNSLELQEAIASLTPNNLDRSNLMELAGPFEEIGVRVLFLVPPFTGKQESDYLLAKVSGLRADYLLIPDSNHYSELLEDATFRADPSHFNRIGARVYSEIVGEALVNHLEDFPVSK